jgi:hypothetical protein
MPRVIIKLNIRDRNGDAQHQWNEQSYVGNWNWETCPMELLRRIQIRKLGKAISFAALALLFTKCGTQEAFYSDLLKDDVFYQEYDNQNYDFLWVMDNSGAMATSRSYIVNNLQSFLNTIEVKKALNFQMSVITTDYFTDQGALVKSPTGLQMVASATSANPVADMTSIFNNIQDSATSFWPQGLENTYQAMSQNGSVFMRNGVPLIVVIISDGDDYSCQDNCYGVQPVNNDGWVPFPLSRYIDYLRTVKAPQNTAVSLFPIVGTPSSQCSLPSLGMRYIDVSDYLGNLSQSGSICSSDIASSYNNIANVIADRGTTFNLSFPASGTNMQVFVDDQQVNVDPDNGWEYDAAQNAIVFSGTAIPANGSTIEVSYTESNN